MGNPVTIGLSNFHLGEWLDTLDSFIRIESVSAGASHEDDVYRAAQWLRDQIRGLDEAAKAEIVESFGSPLVVGEVRATTNPESAPTVLVYGHVDVQPPGQRENWDYPPFAATVHDDWVYGRGTADDKGHLLMLLEAVRRLVADRNLPVNVRFVCDAEEETLGEAIVKYLNVDRSKVDACVIFDSPMLERDIPVFYIGTRGSLHFHLSVRTGSRELHSGTFGGAALNAVHALIEMLASVLPRDGALPEPLRRGTLPVAEEEWQAVEQLRPGADALFSQGIAPADRDAGEQFYPRTWAEPSFDVHGIGGGIPGAQRTAIPISAEANFSMRLAPGQDCAEIVGALEYLLLNEADPGADVKLALLSSTPPSLIPWDSPVITAGQDAVQAVLGKRPLLIRAGGSLPILGALSRRGIPTIITGFDLPDGNIHAANERLLLKYIPLGVATAQELLSRLGRI